MASQAYALIREKDAIRQPALRSDTLRWIGLIAASAAAAAYGRSAAAPDVIVMTTILIAAAVSSIAGFAFSAICGAMLFHLMPDAVRAVQIMIACSIANQAAMTWALRRQTVWREVAPFLIGGMLGVPLGVALLLFAEPSVYTRAIGGFLLLYGVWMLLRRPMTIRRQHWALDVLSGFAGGLTGGAMGTPGAPVSIWCGFKGWDKTRQRALFQPFILVSQIVALTAITGLRPHGTALAFQPADLLCIAPSLLGTAIGLGLFRHLSDAQFGGVINALLIVSGLSFVA